MKWNPFRNRKTRDERRSVLLEKQRGLCAICGWRFPQPGELARELVPPFAPTFDHIVPRSQGGPDDFDNLRLAHRTCNAMRAQELHVPYPIPPPWIPRVLRAPYAGCPAPEPWVERHKCGKRGRRKFPYDDIDQAWRAAFILFAETGTVSTPYRCNDLLLEYRISHVRPCGNPWSFHGYVVRFDTRRISITGCGEWHVTRQTAFILPSGGPAPLSSEGLIYVLD